MQYPFSCTPNAFTNIESCLSTARIGRFLPAAGNDRNFALRLYVWNARICEAFYLPSQLAEISLRNTIHTALVNRYGPGWEQEGRFLCILPNRLKTELQEIRAKELGKKGRRVTIDDIVAGISFGFWVHLLTVNFDYILWKGGINHAFPYAPAGTTRQNVHDRVDALRLWRNRIAHHYAVFDRRPTAEFQNLMEIVRWINPDLSWFVQELSNVTAVINQRPRPIPT